MPYLGVDVGYSQNVRSTGICLISPEAPDPVVTRHVRTQETLGAIRSVLGTIQPVAMSFDGPLVPHPTKPKFTLVNRYRNCERFLSGGIFQKRCKPGPTNAPRGQALHRQTTLLANTLTAQYPTAAVFEAFPNAFLGVMLPDRIFAKPIRRGIKSDVFWKIATHRSNVMQQVLKRLFPDGWERVYSKARRLDDHDERAAFVCALTARAAHSKNSLHISTQGDGTISLGPASFVQSWALAHLRKNVAC